jgi:hypothetical protein
MLFALDPGSSSFADRWFRDDMGEVEAFSGNGGVSSWIPAFAGMTVELPVIFL